ncbi:Aromatic-L-amino-acid decarboxylase [Araneus ventricosus]|uniref:Aromatic-L-amino-acid decarboxylase n=1 Tax=Araneus ventricosus TaxID=182803 RepID=A0A4Y2BMB8_ARAVE|nr:Aromatic-L-amino-acid decarboxylase [Araneus ventricosus]
MHLHHSTLSFGDEVPFHQFDIQLRLLFSPSSPNELRTALSFFQDFLPRSSVFLLQIEFHQPTPLKNQTFLNTHVHLAKEFEKLVLSDDRFEVVAPVHLGLVCFRRKGPNSVNEDLLKRVNARRKIHITPTVVRDKYIIRFAICSRYTTLEDVDFAWREIQLVSSGMLP